MKTQYNRFDIPPFEKYLESHIKSKGDGYDWSYTIVQWNRIIEKYIQKYEVRVSDETMKYLCIICEAYNSYYNFYFKSAYTVPPSGKELSDIIDNIFIDYKRDIQKRVPIVRKVYNFYTNRVEYELEDGTFIQIDEKTTPPEADMSFFRGEYLRIFDVQTLRDKMIDKIIV